MNKTPYTRLALALDEPEKHPHTFQTPLKFRAAHSPHSLIIGVILAVGCFMIGYLVGEYRERVRDSGSEVKENGRFPPQAFVGVVPMKEVRFQFPAEYEDTGVLGDKLWKEIMPLGAGFLRVPYPRQYDIPPSIPIFNDTELSETYSMSITHQLHCLAVLRDVMVKYDAGSKSRFSGDGHEYHCLDYIRQGILCAGDTTLDHATMKIDEQGKIKNLGFMGSDSVHICRDWEYIKNFLIEHRSGDKVGILV